jgi:5-methyltetrahydrofolate--homocysteine methyltransferase
MGEKISQYTQKLFETDEYQNYLYWHGFGVEMAEALAEYWHKQIRQELNIDNNDGPTTRDLISGRYQGARFSFGYPACPRLEDQKILFQLLQPDDIGVKLSEEFQLHPEQSTSAIITTHSEAAYFTI